MDSPKSIVGPEIEVVVDDGGELVEEDANGPETDAAYQRGWTDAVHAVRTALRGGGSWKLDEYFAGWMDAATLQPVDPIRLAPLRSRYARGYAAGAKAYELAQRGGYDAE